MTTTINLYLGKRYQGLLDYAVFHSSRAGIPDEAADILDEVLLSLLQMDELRLLEMLNSKKCKYTELDFFILRMIKLNCYSETAPYRAKLKQIHSSSINLSRLSIEDVTEPENDTPGRILQQFEQVREVFEDLHLSDQAKRIFTHYFINGDKFSEWEGPETKKELYDIYSKVIDLIKCKLFNKSLF